MPQTSGDEYTIGARVRVRLVPGRVCEDAPHKPIEDGQTGTIVRRDSPFGPRLHPLLVEYDEPLAWPFSPGGIGASVPLLVQWYTVDELELPDGC